MLTSHCVQHAKSLLLGEGVGTGEDFEEPVSAVKMMNDTLGIEVTVGWRATNTWQRIDARILSSIADSADKPRIVEQAAQSWSELQSQAASGDAKAVQIVEGVTQAAQRAGVSVEHITGIIFTKNRAGLDNFTARYVSDWPLFETL